MGVGWSMRPCVRASSSRSRRMRLRSVCTSPTVLSLRVS